MEGNKLATLLETKKGLPHCHIHKTEQLSWFCLEQSCQKRIFCSFCIIQDHSRIHKKFANIFSFFKDPVITLNQLDVVEPGNKEADLSLKIRFKVEEAVEKEEKSLQKLNEQMKSELKEKLTSIQTTFKKDLASFISLNEESFVVLEKMKESYSDQSREIFANLDVDDIASLKQGISELFNRYHQDEKMYKQIEETINKIPEVKKDEDSMIKVGEISLKKLAWQTFFTKSKITNFQYSWTFDLQSNCGDMEFSNDGLTVKKKGANHASTLLGSDFLDTSGDVSWYISIDEHVGSYICLGIISNQFNLNLRDNNYGNAHCVCSDSTTYNISHVMGDLRMAPGDVIGFTYKPLQNEFQAIGPQNRFLYKSVLQPGNKYKPFFGFASASRIKITIVPPY